MDQLSLIEHDHADAGREEVAAAERGRRSGLQEADSIVGTARFHPDGAETILAGLETDIRMLALERLEQGKKAAAAYHLGRAAGVADYRRLFTERRARDASAA